MALFGFGASAPIEEFAKQLATYLAKRYPAALEIDLTKKRNPTRRTEAFASTFNRAINIQMEHKLGIYGNAKLAAALKSKPAELAFPDKFEQQVP